MRSRAVISTDVCESFADFMKDLVLPHRDANPGERRLDGWQSGGNWERFGKFRHNGKTWIVNSDTHYEPLLIAYDAMQKNRDLNPFEEQATPKRTALALTLPLRRLQKSRFKHLYIYEEK